MMNFFKNIFNSKKKEKPQEILDIYKVLNDYGEEICNTILKLHIYENWFLIKRRITWIIENNQDVIINFIRTGKYSAESFIIEYVKESSSFYFYKGQHNMCLGFLDGNGNALLSIHLFSVKKYIEYNKIDPYIGYLMLEKIENDFLTP